MLRIAQTNSDCMGDPAIRVTVAEISKYMLSLKKSFAVRAKTMVFQNGYGGRLAASNLRNLRRGAAPIGRANLYRDFDFGLSLGAA
jgi:hypothetical protein